MKLKGKVYVLLYSYSLLYDQLRKIWVSSGWFWQKMDAKGHKLPISQVQQQKETRKVDDNCLISSAKFHQIPKLH